MNKDEILRASREENRGGDEMERYIEMHSEMTAVLSTVAALVMLIVISVARGQDIIALLCVMFAGGAGEMIGKYVKNRKAVTLVGGIMFGMLFLVTLISFMRGQTFVVSVLWDSFFH